MTLEEALKSDWNGSHQKVQDLLRAGKLTFKELRVTANRSNDPSQKTVAQALWMEYEAAYAQVFPPSSSQTFLMGLPDVKLTLEDARLTLWKGRNGRGEAMGRNWTKEFSP